MDPMVHEEKKAESAAMEEQKVEPAVREEKKVEPISPERLQELFVRKSYTGVIKKADTGEFEEFR